MFFNILWYFSFNPIKQVNYSGLYITDDTNTAKFPEPTGRFSTINLFHRGHYEVHGDPDQLPPTPAVPVPFSFTRRPSPSASASTETPPRAGIPRAVRHVFKQVAVTINTHQSINRCTQYYLLTCIPT